MTDHILTPTTASAETEVGAWGRRRLLLTLTLAGLVVAVLIAGLGYAIYLAFQSPQAAPGEGSGSAEAQDPQTGVVIEALPSGQARRDAIAAALMLTVPPEAARSGTPDAHPAAGIPIPPAGTVGPAGVATGYPRTPEGAVGQLAATAQSVLQTMSIEHTNAVHGAWAESGAVPVADWDLMGSVQAFLAATSQHGAALSTVVVVATPVAAQVKGTDGTDWVLACVLFDVEARAAATARVAYGHCSRMHWQPEQYGEPTSTNTGRSVGGRWVIAAGAQPARAPSTWPGTELAAEAGWLTWVPVDHDDSADDDSVDDDDAGVDAADIDSGQDG